MKLDAPSTASPQWLAQRLERDIRRRGLRVGERYLSTRQVQQQYDVSLAVAARAMELLVAKQVLERRDRSGTFIGPYLPSSEASSCVKVIHVFMHEELAHFSLLSLDLLIQTLLRPDHKGDSPAHRYGVQFAYLPDGNEIAVADELIKNTQSSGQLYGVVAVSCGRDVYRFLDRRGIPTVVFGSLDPDLKHIPSVDADYFTAGHLMAGYLLQRGHESLGLLGITRGNVGDHAFLDGVAQAMTEAGRPPNALLSRLCQHASERLIRAHAEALLSQPSGPRGLICRSESVAELVCDVANRLGLRVPGDVDVVYEAVATGRGGHLPHPHVQTREPFERIVMRIRDMLERLVEGQPLEEHRTAIPVELHLPEQERQS